MTRELWEDVPMVENLPDEAKQRVDIILSMTIPYLLANGRPPEASAAPDVLHLLLLRQEQAHDEAERENLLDSESDADADAELNAIDANNWVDIEPSEHNSPACTSTMMSPNASQTTVASPLVSHEVSTIAVDNIDYDSAWRNELRQSNAEESGIRTETREERKAAAVWRKIKEAQVPQHRRRMTVEEVYGEGANYTYNPLNLELLAELVSVQRKDSTCTHNSTNSINVNANKRKSNKSLSSDVTNTSNNNIYSTRNSLTYTNIAKAATTTSKAATATSEISCNTSNIIENHEMLQISNIHANNEEHDVLLFSPPHSQLAATAADRVSTNNTKVVNFNMHSIYKLNNEPVIV